MIVYLYDGLRPGGVHFAFALGALEDTVITVSTFVTLNLCT